MSGDDQATVESEIARLRDLLRQVIVGAKVSFRDVERRTGMGQGLLNKVLSGTITLGLHHVLLTLHAIDYPPDRFFEIALRPRGATTPQAETISDLLEEIDGPRARRKPMAVGDLPPEELKDLFIKAILEAKEKEKEKDTASREGTASLLSSRKRVPSS